jgi:hypothetical protein
VQFSGENTFGSRQWCRVIAAKWICYAECNVWGMDIVVWSTMIVSLWCHIYTVWLWDYIHVCCVCIQHLCSIFH